MPAPLDVDREAVKAHAITHGVRPAARAFNLSEEVVKKWSQREGWLKDCRVPIPVPTQPLPATMRPRAVPDVPTASEAARNQKQTYGESAKLSLLRGAVRGARHIANRSGKQIAEQWTGPMVALAKTVSTLLPEQSSPSTVVNLAFIQNNG